LTELIRKDVQFKWEERQQTAFEKLKEILCSEQVLAYPDFNSRFILTTDASQVAVAGILSQVQNGVERPISYSEPVIECKREKFFRYKLVPPGCQGHRETGDPAIRLAVDQG